eukprot:3168541-Rhodomonas_salina.1
MVCCQDPSRGAETTLAVRFLPDYACAMRCPLTAYARAKECPLSADPLAVTSSLYAYVWAMSHPLSAHARAMICPLSSLICDTRPRRWTSAEAANGMTEPGAVTKITDKSQLEAMVKEGPVFAKFYAPVRTNKNKMGGRKGCGEGGLCCLFWCVSWCR